MPAIEAYQRTVFRAPTRGRTFLTAKAAARSEAAALIKSKYPTERPEFDDCQMIYDGYHWSSEERLVRLHERLSRMILKKMKARATGGKE